MQFGYVIAYVADVAASLTFFESAFGFRVRFIDPSGTYGELDTGATLLAFAHHSLAEENFGRAHVAADSAPDPLGVEIGFVTDDVESSHRRAMSAGATELAAPKEKPWGQTVSYVRSPDGLLIELCTPTSK